MDLEDVLFYGKHAQEADKLYMDKTNFISLDVCPLTQGPPRADYQLFVHEHMKCFVKPEVVLT